MPKLQFNNFTYITEQSLDFGKGLKIEYNIEKPQSVYKYYYPSKYNIDSLTNCEFFCSHPYQFNDLTDSNPLSYDYRNFQFDDFKGLYLTLGNITIDQIKKMYDEDKLNGFKTYRMHFYSILTQHLGIVCVSTNEMHNLMWGYYASDAGFKIKYNTQSLLESIKDLNKLNYLFFPINYIENKLHVDVNQYGPSIPMLVDISTKVKHWKHENEWRIVVSKNDMDVPSSLVTPHLKDHIGRDSRLIKFSPNTIEEIVFGMNFFNGRICNIIANVSPTENLMEINNESFTSFLKFVSHELQDKCYMSGIFTDIENPIYEGASPIERSVEEVKIKHINNNIFSIQRINPGYCKRFPNIFD